MDGMEGSGSSQYESEGNLGSGVGSKAEMRFPPKYQRHLSHHCLQNCPSPCLSRAGEVNMHGCNCTLAHSSVTMSSCASCASCA